MIIDPTFHLVKGKDIERNDVFKQYQESWYINPIQDIVGEGPIQLDIELNNTCNYHCKMCFQSFDPPVPKYMDLGTVKGLIHQAVKIGVKSLKLNYRGEPLMYPFIKEVITLARQEGILETLINTNAYFLGPGMCKKLIEAGLGKIICSIDGILPETYEKIRQGGDLDRVMRNVATMISMKELYGSELPIVRVQIVEQEDNKAEIKRFIEFWSNGLADEVAIEDCKDYAGDVEDGTELPNWYCSQLWQRLFVLADGTIQPCCRAMEGGSSCIYKLGNINNTHIKEIWEGPDMTLLRKAHRAGKSHEISMCRKCGIRKEVIRQNVH